MRNPFNIEYSEEQLEQARQQLMDDVRPHVHGEELVTAGRFRRGGFSASYAASKGGGGWSTRPSTWPARRRRAACRSTSRSR
jgi:hypothetical protein